MDLKFFIKQRLNCNYKCAAIWKIRGHPLTQRQCSLNVNRKGVRSVFIMSTVSSWQVTPQVTLSLWGRSWGRSRWGQMTSAILGVHFLKRHSQLLAKCPLFFTCDILGRWMTWQRWVLTPLLSTHTCQQEVYSKSLLTIYPCPEWLVGVFYHKSAATCSVGVGPTASCGIFMSCYF